VSQLSPILRAAEGGRLLFQCPGCKLVHGPWVGPGDGPRWTWNGDANKPTFTPSILVTWPEWWPPVTAENYEQFKAQPWEQHKVDRVCHSFVKDGQIQFLGDCTHALSGQTVDLPVWTHTDSTP
jgi:hypothetical protein